MDWTSGLHWWTRRNRSRTRSQTNLLVCVNLFRIIARPLGTGRIAREKAKKYAIMLAVEVAETRLASDYAGSSLFKVIVG